MQDLDPRELDAIGRHIKSGRKIEAIKLLRESSGLGLAEAKDWIEEFASTGSPPGQGGGSAPRSSSRAPGEGLPLDVQSLLRRGRESDAIKALRSARGIGLGAAKQEIDGFLKRHPELANRGANGPARMIAVVVVVVLLLAGWLVTRMTT